MAKIKDLTGQKFGKLTVLGIGYKQETKYYWKVQCDCGNIVNVIGPSLKSGECKSCGCSRKHIEGEVALNRIWNNYKQSAKYGDYEFSLTKEEFLELITSNCKYCGIEPRQISKSNNGNFVYNGIDRIDSSKGYTKENCVTACKDCNYAKQRHSVEEFYQWIDRINKHKGTNQ